MRALDPVSIKVEAEWRDMVLKTPINRSQARDNTIEGGT
jgi:hypothetical protein